MQTTAQSTPTIFTDCHWSTGLNWPMLRSIACAAPLMGVQFSGRLRGPNYLPGSRDQKGAERLPKKTKSQRGRIVEEASTASSKQRVLLGCGVSLGAGPA